MNYSQLSDAIPESIRAVDEVDAWVAGVAGLWVKNLIHLYLLYYILLQIITKYRILVIVNTVTLFVKSRSKFCQSLICLMDMWM